MPTILVAEDSFALSNLLGFVLKNAGLEVDLHLTGTAALEAGQQKKFDMILLDQQMPGMTGLEVAEELRGSGPNTETPLFLCTAKTHELDLDEIRARLDITEVFHKPFSPKYLVENLKRATANVVAGWGAA